MEDPEIIVSPLSRVVEEDGISVEVGIYRLEHTDWSLEIVAEDGTPTVWAGPFEDDQSALVEALKAIRTKGIASFSEKKAVKPTFIVHGRTNQLGRPMII